MLTDDHQWHRIVIDPDEPGFCLDCLGRHRYEKLKEMVESVPREKPYPGRCLICRGPLGPKRPLD